MIGEKNMDVLSVIMCMLFALAGYFIVRNFFVMMFGSKIIDLCSKHNLRREDETRGGYYESAYDWFFHKYSYGKFLFSFKPLKLKYWYTEEEIERLMS